MNITLRKANAVQNSINDVIKNIKIETTIDLNEFQDPNLVLTDANNKLFPRFGWHRKCSQRDRREPC
jgi:hypothetical protein